MTNQSYQGVSGIIRPFKEYLEAWKFTSENEVVFYGAPGTCTPFIELLCNAVQSLTCTFLFVPFLKENESRKMIYSEGIGFQVGEFCPITSPSVIVLMGGLALPEVQGKPNLVKEILMKYPDVARVGISFLHIFKQAKWLDKISFDLMIDVTIVVDVTSQ